jgi:hypothetical protein
MLIFGSVTEKYISNLDARHIAMGFKMNNLLVSIDMQGNEIGNEGAEAIAQALTGHNNLKTLDLSWNEIKDQGVADLALMTKSTNIRTIRLKCNVAAALSADSATPLLTPAAFTDNLFGREGNAALLDALKTSTSIRTIDVEGGSMFGMLAIDLHSSSERTRPQGIKYSRKHLAKSVISCLFTRKSKTSCSATITYYRRSWRPLWTLVRSTALCPDWRASNFPYLRWGA